MWIDDPAAVKCHQRPEHVQSAVVKFIGFRGFGEIGQDIPFIDRNDRIRFHLTSRYRPPKIAFGCVFQKNITKDNTIQALHRDAELTESRKIGYLRSAKFENGLPGLYLGGFSFWLSLKCRASYCCFLNCLPTRFSIGREGRAAMLPRYCSPIHQNPARFLMGYSK